MAVLLVLGKILGVLLLVVVLVLAAALLVPLRLTFEYRPGHVQLAASYGPLRRTLFSRGGKRRRGSPPGPKPGGEPASPQSVSEPIPGKTTAETAPSPETVQSREQGPRPAAEEAAEKPAEKPGRLEHILHLAQHQPMVLLRCLTGHFHWMRRHAVCKLRVRHLDVFWTVTCEDAADTALAFGAEMAAFNTLLAVLQQSISVQSDRLWLEPDFTGERRSERRISFSLSACAVLMVGLAYRLWKDPLLQPQPETAQT